MKRIEPWADVKPYFDEIERDMFLTFRAVGNGRITMLESLSRIHELLRFYQELYLIYEGPVINFRGMVGFWARGRKSYYHD
ncbi:hypothetical protein KAU11_11655 [Candidatus Babeliales bacterium]|nr:hypothetical protein [Candidatus Babeliales bacterium]